MQLASVDTSLVIQLDTAFSCGIAATTMSTARMLQMKSAVILAVKVASNVSEAPVASMRHWYATGIATVKTDQMNPSAVCLAWSLAVLLKLMMLMLTWHCSQLTSHVAPFMVSGISMHCTVVLLPSSAYCVLSSLFSLLSVDSIVRQWDCRLAPHTTCITTTITGVGF